MESLDIMPPDQVSKTETMARGALLPQIPYTGQCVPIPICI